MTAPAASSGPVDDAGRPLIRKLGTIDCDLVETSPVVFKGRLYRFEYVREGYTPNTTGDSYLRFVDHETGAYTQAFGHGWHMASAYVEAATAYVTAANIWDGENVDVFASDDLENWRQWPALRLPGYGIFNTSVWRDDKQYVMMFEIGRPEELAGVRFTAQFATSPDLKQWELTPPECNYSKDRYTAPHCLRYLDGYYYNFYLEALPGPNYETRVVRSRDLISWEPSPLDPVLIASPEDRQIANPALAAAERQRIANAVNLNSSDIDFCEHEGRLVINYSWGNQVGVEHLAEAVYEGSLEQFLRGWYP